MQKVIPPPFLSKGDEIRIVAPASAVQKEYIEQTMAALRNQGFKVSLGNHIFSNYFQFAGTDAERTEDFQNALDDEHVRAVFCARGGYGSVRIVDKIDFSPLKIRPKWIAGFSDITIFHNHLNCNYRIASIHSPMPVNFHNPGFQKNLARFHDILGGEKPAFQFSGNTLNRPGICSGELTGGNLSILCSLQSTPYETDTQGKILFIEDVGEQHYRLDRLLYILKLSGRLKHLSGLIIGGMTEMYDNKRPFGKTPYEIILDAVKDYDFPVAFDFPAGHTARNLPFILGLEISMEINHEGVTIKYQN